MLNPVLRVKYRIFLHTLEEIKKAPIIRTFLIAFFMLGVICACYYFANYIFGLLNGIEGAGPFLCDKLLGLFFMSLFFLLIFSNAISSYSTIFKAKEINMLLRYPISYSQLFVLRFLESASLTSWAFLVLIGPFLYAYFKVKGVGLPYLPISFVYLMPYLVITASIGSLLTLLLVKLIPRRDLRPYLLFVLICGIMASIAYFRHLYIKRELGTKGEIIFFISQLMPYFNIAEFPYLPSNWLTKSLIHLTGGNYPSSLFYLWLLIVTSLFGFQLLYNLIPYTYYNCLVSLGSQGGLGRGVRRGFWNFMRGVFFFLSGPERELVIKDIKSMVRDPIQYSQILIFFGILAVYFTNLQGRYYQTFPPKWKIFIAFLNFAATNLVLASLAVRFVFPLMSLEGRRMWVLNLAPISRWRMLFSKYLVISFFALMITISLITISNSMLGIRAEFKLATTLCSLISSFTLIAISIGLGSCFPNFRQDNPSRIIAGFGGTLSLIISLLYVALMLFLLGLPFQLNLLGKIADSELKFYLGISILTLYLISALLIYVHLYAGKRRLELFEF